MSAVEFQSITICRQLKGDPMPQMRRFEKKSTKIAWKILGKPANLAFKRTPKEKKINRQLVFQETTRSR